MVIDKYIKLRIVSALIILLGYSTLSLHYLASSANVQRTGPFMPDRNNFAPRLGLVYDIFGDGRTVFRSGVGLFYDRTFNNMLFNLIQNPPNYSTTFLTNVPLTASLLTDQYSVFPNSPVTLSGSSARHVDQDLRTAYSVSWNATLEREVMNTLVVRFSYVGSGGVGLFVLNDMNRIGSGQFLGRPNTRLNQNVSSTSTRTLRDIPVITGYNSWQRSPGSVQRIGEQSARSRRHCALQRQPDGNDGAQTDLLNKEKN